MKKRNIKHVNNRILEISEDHKQITLPDSRYYRRNGEYYPSITHVLGSYPKGKHFEEWLKNMGRSADYIVRKGRGATQDTRGIAPQPCVIKWDHKAPNDVRIDPSISNVVEILVLTNTYYTEIQKYINVPGTAYPLSPTSNELTNEFNNLESFKSASDTIVYRSAKIKRIYSRAFR